MTVIDQPLTSAESAAGLIGEHIAKQRGFSMVRVGDGEGVLLSRPSLMDPALGPYLTTHFGPDVTQSDLNQLIDRLTSAIDQAQLIGVRPDVSAHSYPTQPLAMGNDELVSWARQHLPLRTEEKETLESEGALRLILLGIWLTGFHRPQQAQLTSAWLHYDWLESGFLAQLAKGQGHIALVTGRTQLAEKFRAAGIRVDEWPVPLRFLTRGTDWTPHFPERFNEIIDTVEPSFPGQVFFVGAGICGKVYCDVIARRGGIALDVGAICDMWLGLPTRPRVALSRWGAGQVPEHFLLDRQLADSSELPRSWDHL